MRLPPQAGQTKLYVFTNKIVGQTTQQVLPNTV